MATVRMVLKKKTKGQEFYPVNLRVSLNGEYTYIVTGFIATTNIFDESKECGRFNAGHGIKPFNVIRIVNGKSVQYTNKTANDELAKIENRARDIIMEYQRLNIQWSLETFRKDFLFKPSTITFYDYAQKMISKYNDTGHYKKAQILSETIRALELFDKKINRLKFQDINYSYLNSFIEDQQGKNNSGNTIAIRLCEIRSVLNDAILNGCGCQQTYPFGSEKEHKISVKKFKESETMKDNFLPMKYLSIFAKAELNDLRLETAKHLFLFSYFCNGANWRDIAYLTNTNITTTESIDPVTGETNTFKIIRYTRGKTKKVIEIGLTNEIQREIDWFKQNCDLLDDYLLPIIQKHESERDTLQHVSDARCRFNLTLRKITELLEFPDRFKDIAAYTARHTYAVSMQVMGASIDEIGRSLGHQETDGKTAKNYTAKTIESKTVFDPTK